MSLWVSSRGSRKDISVLYNPNNIPFVQQSRPQCGHQPEFIMNFRKLAVAAAATLTLNAASAAVLTPNDIFVWVEKDFPTIFPRGSATQVGVYQGCTYDFRYYNTNGGVYIGVCRTNNHIATYNVVGPGFVDHGDIDLQKCSARPDMCSTTGPSFAGTLMFSNDGGTSVTIAANYKNNKLWGVGADRQGFEIPVSEIDALCAHSIRLANWDKSTGPGCNRPQVNGELKIAGLPNNDCSRFTVWWRGQEYWLDLGTATGYRFTGLGAKLNSSCGIEYGPNGFMPARIYQVREADNTASLVWDFGSDYVSGFGQSTFDDPTKVYAFVLNGEHQGVNYGSGWGLGAGRKTSEGFDIQPSIRMAWVETDSRTGNRFIKFRNLACTDKVNTTTYVGTGPANNVTYDFGRDGFGRGWASVGGSAPFWTAGSGVTINATTSQVQYGVPFCTQR